MRGIRMDEDSEIDIGKRKLIVNLLRENIVKNIITLDISDLEKRNMIMKVIQYVIEDAIILFPHYKTPLIKRVEILLDNLKKN